MSLLSRLLASETRTGPRYSWSEHPDQPAGLASTSAAGAAAASAQPGFDRRAHEVRDVPPAMVIDQQTSETVSVRTGAAAQPIPDPAAVSALVSELAAKLVKGLDRWPGSVLVAGGVILVAAAFGAEYFEGDRLGVVEFVAALAVGLCLAVAGAGVISRDGNRAQALAADAIKSREQRAARRKSIAEGGES